MNNNTIFNNYAIQKRNHSYSNTHVCFEAENTNKQKQKQKTYLCVFFCFVLSLPVFSAMPAIFRLIY